MSYLMGLCLNCFFIFGSILSIVTSCTLLPVVVNENVSLLLLDPKDRVYYVILAKFHLNTVFTIFVLIFSKLSVTSSDNGTYPF